MLPDSTEQTITHQELPPEIAERLSVMLGDVEQLVHQINDHAHYTVEQHLGRPSKKADTLLEDYPDVVRAHNNGLSLRKASAETGRAVNTIRKVYDVLKVRK